MRYIAAAFCLSLGTVALASAQSTTGSTTRPRSGFSPSRLARIDSLLQRAVDENQIGGAVALVLRDGQTAYARAVGWADKEAGRRMRIDDIFRIASQTKALTSVAVMMLVEEGRLRLGDPLSRYISTFAGSKVATKSDTGLAIVAARRAITIKDLLTHTAGISYGTDAHVAALYAAKGLGPEAGYGWYTADKNEPICETMERLGTLPSVAQPGEAWVYGYGIDILGCVVERVSGLPLDEFFRRRITGPLQMKDTHLFLPVSKRDRLTVVYASDSLRRVVRAPDGAKGQGHYVDGPRRSFAGGAGLLSTARDYSRFLQMLLNGGELDGVRLLAPRTVRLMTTNLVDTLFSATGLGFGLGFFTVDRFGADEMSTLGTYGWGGAYASDYKVDPVERLVMVFMMQMLPDRSAVGGRFSTLVYQALIDSHQ
ncbi:MAG: serine hydrolase domain-containing protein [Gemmatimonadaceae bacterium]